jgi:hypothetical protein
MRTDDYSRFRAVMTGMAKVYEREIDAPLLDAYWLALRTWDLGDFESAAGHLIGTSKFMPRPADFNGLRQAAELTAGEAWALALSGAALDPGSRIARAAAIVGGQQHMRMADIERDLPHIQRRFLAAYEELADADQTRAALPQIAGPLARIAATALKRIA